MAYGPTLRPEPTGLCCTDLCDTDTVNYFLDCSFLCRPIWWNATVSAFPHVLIVGGGTAFLPLLHH